jgi:arylsulfatase A-like enzyme
MATQRSPKGIPKWTNRPNVIVLFDDQLRASVCGVYGGQNITTPNIDRLANQGVTFINATSTCPLCTPFRGMLQTGRYPTHSGLVLNFADVNPNQKCVAHIFRDAGYDTAFIGKWHLSAGRLKMAGKHGATKQDAARIRKGIDKYHKINPETEFVPPGPQRLGYEHWQSFNFHCDFNNYWYYEDEQKKLFSQKYETDTEVDQAITFVEKQKKSSKPFFLMVAPHPPHPPFELSHSPRGYLEKVPKNLHWLPNVPQNQIESKTAEDARHYYAMSKNVDDNLGRLIDYLDSSGLSAETILVFTADHGEMLGSHNRRNKMVPYAEAVNIPLIIRWPGRIPQSARSNELYTPIDHMPTLCSLAGLDRPHTCDGTDLSSVVLGAGKANREVVLMANYVSHWDYFDSGTHWPEWRGVRTKQFAYVKWLSGKEELYDNMSDPYQMTNLAEGRKDQSALKKLRAHLKELLAEAHDEFLPGTAYADWYDDQRNLIRTGLGPV